MLNLLNQSQNFCVFNGVTELFTRGSPNKVDVHRGSKDPKLIPHVLNTKKHHKMQYLDNAEIKDSIPCSK